MTNPAFTTPTPPAPLGPVADPLRPLVHQVTVDRAVISFLQRWLPTYLTEVERREGKTTRWLPRPRVWKTVYEDDDQDFYSDARMPTVLVTTGEAGDWVRDGDVNYAATYRTAISVVSRGRSIVEARLQSSLYIAAITMLLLDKPSIDGFAGGVEVISERPRAIDDPTNRSRNLSAGMGTYDIWVPYVRRGLNTPFVPTEPDVEPDPPPDPDQPWPDTPTTQEVDVDFVGHEPLYSPPPAPVLITTVRGVRCYTSDRITGPTQTRTISASSDRTDISNRKAVVVLLDKIGTSGHTITITNRHATDSLDAAFYTMPGANLVGTIISGIAPGQTKTFVSANDNQDLYGVVYFTNTDAGTFQVSADNAGALVAP